VKFGLLIGWLLVRVQSE